MTDGYSLEEEAIILKHMKTVSGHFYTSAVIIQCHAFIEFTGLMNEYINICQNAHQSGQRFMFANKHSEEPLSIRPHQIKYLADKFDCIFGPMLKNPENRMIFLKAMGWKKGEGN